MRDTRRVCDLSAAELQDAVFAALDEECGCGSGRWQLTAHGEHGRTRRIVPLAVDDASDRLVIGRHRLESLTAERPAA